MDTMMNDPYSRRILMTTFNPAQVNEGCLYPCHSIVTQFYLKEDPTTPNVFYVSQQTYIRSNDIFLGNPYNVASSALLSILLCHHLTHIRKDVTYLPDQLHVVLGDYHLYKSHYDVAKEQCERKPFAFPTIKIKPNEDRTRIEYYQFEDLVLEGYECHPPLKAPMVP
jgi:thymidylate synthase